MKPPHIELVPIKETGATVAHYKRVGFTPPFICYFGSLNGRLVGTCGFKSAPRILVTAQTLPHESASMSILKKLGFTRAGEVLHPENGKVWDWHLARLEIY